jgi:hypothetical protein
LKKHIELVLAVCIIVSLVLGFYTFWRNAGYDKAAHYSAGTLNISNNILTVSIQDTAGASGIGTFTIRTDSGHPNAGQNVFYGGAGENPWSTFTTIRVEDTLKEYVTSEGSKTASSGYTVEYLDDYSPVVTKVGDTEATVSWTTSENLVVTLLIDIRGTTVANTMVEVTVTIENQDTSAHNVAVRHEWDLMIDGDDDSWIRAWTDPSTPQSWTETETDWVSPSFQFWETVNNPITPVFSIYGSAVLPSAVPPPTLPDRLVYASWSASYYSAYDYTPTGDSGMDSAVLYYWNAAPISSSAQISKTAYVTTVVQAELQALAWSTDAAGNSKTTFESTDNVYVKGQDFPAETDVTIYLIPDGATASPANAVASTSETTEADGDLSVTPVWLQLLTAGEYDIWVDVNQNGEFDAGDVWNNQAGGIYAFSVTQPPVAPTIGSCDSIGAQKDSFNLDDVVWVSGSDYAPSTTYDFYIVQDKNTWTTNDPLVRVPGTATTVASDGSGNVQPTAVWGEGAPQLTLGKYDIIVDVNGNGKYDEGIDALDSNDIVTTAGFLVIPEYWLGAILGLAGCFAAFGVFRISKRKHT